MENLLEPIAVLPLEVSPGGTGSFAPQIQSAGGDLFVSTSTWNGWSWGRLAWHAPDFAAILMLLSIAAFVRIAWKARRRGRRSGGVYCSRCHHELTAPQVEITDGLPRWAAATCCPECGGSDGPEIAGAYARRAKWKALTCAAVVALCVVVLARTLTGKANATQSWRSLAAWPLWQLPYVLPEWPLFRAMSADEYRRVSVSKLLRREGNWRLESLLTGDPGGGEWVSPDGRWVALPSGERTVRVLDTSTGRIRRFEIDSGREMKLMVAGFGKASVLLCLVGSRPNVRLEFWRVDIEAEKQDRFGLVEVPNAELEISSFLFPAALESAEGLRWAFAGTTIRADPSRRWFAFVGGPEGWKKVNIDSEQPLGSARIAPDLSGVRLDWNPVGAQGRDSSPSFWAFASGRIEDRPTTVPAGVIQLSFQRSSATPTLWNVFDVSRQTEVAQLRAGSNGSWFASADGRFVAQWEWTQAPSWLAQVFNRWPPNQRGMLRIWALSYANEKAPRGAGPD